MELYWNIYKKVGDNMDFVKAFLIGGAICAIVQILMDRTKLMPGRIMVLLVCTGSVLGAIGIYNHLWNLPVPVLLCRFWDLEMYCGRALKKQLMKIVLSVYSWVASRQVQSE